MVSCDGCHSRFLTRTGSPSRCRWRSATPVTASSTVLRVSSRAPSAASATRRPSIWYRRTTAVQEFAGKPHADRAARLGADDYMMCHTASEDCNPCHVEEDVEIDPLPDASTSVIRERSKGPSIKIYPDGPTNMAQCDCCPPDLDAIIPGRLIFAHAQHLQRAYPCESCHPSSARPAVSRFRICSRVIGATGCSIRDRGSSLRTIAALVTPRASILVPLNHTKKFLAGEHKVRAGADPAYCAMCHTTEFCVDCHRGPTPPASRSSPQITRRARG